MGIVDVVIAYSFIKDLTVPFNKTKAFEYGIIDKDGKILKKRNELEGKEKGAYPTILTTLAWNIKKLLVKIAIGKSSIASFATALYLLKEELGGEFMNGPEFELVNYMERNLYGSQRQKLINEAFSSCLLPQVISEGNYVVFGEEISLREDKKPFRYVMGVPLYEAKTKEGKRIVFSNVDVEEDAPTNNVGGGMIKGAAPGEDPPIRLKKKKRIYELMGRYTVFEISPEEFEKCSCAKKKFEKWNKFFDEDSETGSAIKKYSHNNPEKGIILRNSESGETMMFRRRWSDQRLTHNRKAKMLVQSQQNEIYSLWAR